MSDGEPRLVRPYLLTGGRTRSERADVALDATLRTTTSGRSVLEQQPAEQAAVLRTCREPTALPEVAAALGLPIGVVRVLAADLVGVGHLTTTAVSTGDDVDLLERLLVGLKDQL